MSRIEYSMYQIHYELSLGDISITPIRYIIQTEGLKPIVCIGINPNTAMNINQIQP